MKDYLRQILNGIANPVLARCLVREYLQARLLQSLQDRGAFHTWAFQGGTALRFLYSMTSSGISRTGLGRSRTWSC